MRSVRALGGYQEYRNMTLPGSVCFVDHDICGHGAVIACPCGCRRKVWLDLSDYQGAQWLWNGDRWEDITIRPAIDFSNACKGHPGIWLLTASVFTEITKEQAHAV